MNLVLIAGLGFAGFGSYMLRHAIANYQKASASSKWPSVNGRLTDVRLWGKRNIDGEMKDAEHLIVAYEYEARDKTYTGSSPAFYTLVYPETLKFAHRHAVNGDVKVYYNPEDPAESVLIPGLKKDKPHSELILASLALLGGLVVAVAGWMGIIG